MNFTGNTFNTNMPQGHHQHHQQQYYAQANGESDEDGEYDDEEEGEIDPNLYAQQQQFQQQEDEEEEELSPEEIRAIINSYAAFKYEEPAGSSTASIGGTSKKEENQTNCAICIDALKTGQMVKALPCSHKFHSKCINDWLKVKLKCPLCKQSVITGPIM